MANETAQMKHAREVAEKLADSKIEVIGDWPHVDGVPMVKISTAAAELIPTVQFGNCVVGPVQLTCFATPGGELLFSDEGIAKAISRVCSLAEAAVADERQTVHALTSGSRSR